MTEHLHINSVTEAHKFLGFPKPKHPLISIFRHQPGSKTDFGGIKISGSLYFIALKDGITGDMTYGKTSYDFNEGVLTFIGPEQVASGHRIEVAEDSEGWNIIFHPDLIRSFELGRSIDAYSYFDYDTHEALHLSSEEQDSLTDLVRKLEIEINGNKDKHSQKLIVSNLELILDYCKRYYDRQFYTRTDLNSDVVSRFDRFLKEYFNAGKQLELGIPTVRFCGQQLGISPNYLSDLLKKESGSGTQDHIHSFIVDKAKNLLLSTPDSISSIAYDLGFEYSQHFSKLFKIRTGQSPLEYRADINLN